MKVLVTGGRGYVGSAVTHMLGEQGHDVTMMSRQAGPHTVVADLQDRQQVINVVKSVNPDAIVHLAALTKGRESLEKPLEYFEVNVGGTMNVLHGVQELARPIRVVYGSSNIVYGSRYEGRPMAEDFDCLPESPYASSKYAAEQLVQAVAATAAISAVSLRIFNVAGAYNGKPDPDTSRIIPNALRALTGEIPHITINGDGSALRDFVHIADVASAIAMVVAMPVNKQTHYECFNVASGVGTSMATIVETIERISGRPVPVQHTAAKPEPQKLVADISHIVGATDWRPVHSSLDTIIRDSLEAWNNR